MASTTSSSHLASPPPPPPPPRRHQSPPEPGLPLHRGVFDISRPQTLPPDLPPSTSADEHGKLHLHIDVDDLVKTSQFPASSLNAARFLATRVFDIPSFVHPSSATTDAAKEEQESAVLSVLAPRCEDVAWDSEEQASMKELANAGWRAAVLVGAVPSAPPPSSGGTLVGSPASIKSPHLNGAAPTTPLKMAGRYAAATSASNGYMDSNTQDLDEDDEEEDNHRTLYVSLPEAETSVPSPPSTSPTRDATANQTQLGRPANANLIRPSAPPRRSSSNSTNAKTSKNVSATLRHAVLTILDLASESTLQCSTVVFVLERNRPDLADLLHGLCYVGGQVLHVKGVPHSIGGARTSSGMGARGLVRGSSGSSWTSGSHRGSPVIRLPGALRGAGPASGSVGSTTSVTAGFPGQVVMPLRIGDHHVDDDDKAGVDDEDLLLLPRSDVILVAVAL
ncbi:hypothetical protein OC846_005636 [Tilletia horrida]|uniref:Ornithine decarboxylase antizyme n=1 Tax=Tilletia horrida TaxID=155126 RepID=A0AAN6GMY9_9BASI|nr:hypothetical protein OC845_005812 [Tilletia horrida]KAK0545515.1 hypothetical protein OC846_005636 [Tilletia horrida]